MAALWLQYNITNLNVPNVSGTRKKPQKTSSLNSPSTMKGRGCTLLLVKVGYDHNSPEYQKHQPLFSCALILLCYVLSNNPSSVIRYFSISGIQRMLRILEEGKGVDVHVSMKTAEDCALSKVGRILAVSELQACINKAIEKAIAYILSFFCIVCLSVYV